LDVYHTSTHGAARGLLEIQDAKKCHFGTVAQFVGPSVHIFGTKACIDNRKKLLNSNTSSTSPANMVNVGLPTAEICWRVWGTPGSLISTGFASRQRYCTALQ